MLINTKLKDLCMVLMLSLTLSSCYRIGGTSLRTFLSSSHFTLVPFLSQIGDETDDLFGGPGSAAGDDRVERIAVNNNGEAFIVGFTTGSLGEANAGGYDVVVAKYDSSGDLAWITQIGAVTELSIGGAGSASGFDIGSGIALDDSSNVYITGMTTGNLSGETVLGLSDVFVAKLNSDGAVQWISQIGDTTDDTLGGPGSSNGGEEGTGITLDSFGNILIVGDTEGSIGEANGGGRDVFIAKLNPKSLNDLIDELSLLPEVQAVGFNYFSTINPKKSTP